MAYVFGSPKISVRANTTYGDKFTFGSVSQTGAQMSPQQTAAQLSKLTAIVGVAVIPDRLMYRNAKEEVVSDGE